MPVKQKNKKKIQEKGVEKETEPPIFHCDTFSLMRNKEQGFKANQRIIKFEQCEAHATQNMRKSAKKAKTKNFTKLK